jgi:hypothetical protein
MRLNHGPRISSAPRRESGALRSIRGTNTNPHSRRALRPSFGRILRPAKGVGNAGCPLHPQPRAQSVDSTRVSHHGRTGTPGIPARNGFNGFLRALPGDRALLSPSPRGRFLPRNLTPTIEASGPHDFAVRVSAVRPRKYLRCVLPRPPHPLPYVRDDRETPLCVGPGWQGKVK